MMAASSYTKLYKDAINRILNDVPLRIPAGSRITQKNVTLEIGFSQGVTSTLRRNYPEILEMIENAQQTQLKTDNAYTRQVLAPFYEALDRLRKNTPIRLPVNSKVNIKNVALEAGKAEGAIRQDRINYLPIIKAIQNSDEKDTRRKLDQRKIELKSALQRIIEGKPLRVAPNCPVTAKSVSEEAGLNSRYICFHRVELKDLIKDIQVAKTVVKAA